MTVKQWQGEGFCVFVRSGWVYIQGPPWVNVIEANMVEYSIDYYRTPVDNGKWMNHDDLTSAPWENVTKTLSDEAKKNFEATERDCYCRSLPDSMCDFCSGMRTPDKAPYSQSWRITTPRHVIEDADSATPEDLEAAAEFYDNMRELNQSTSPG